MTRATLSRAACSAAGPSCLAKAYGEGRYNYLAIASGLIQFDDIERFRPNGAVMKDGSVKTTDLIVLATGYEGQAAARRILGHAVGARMVVSAIMPAGLVSALPGIFATIRPL